MTSTFQCEYCQYFTFKRCDKFKLKCTSHGGTYSALYLYLDLTVNCERFYFGSEMFLAVIALLMVCNVSVIY